MTERRVYAAAQVKWRRAYFASCRLEVDGEEKLEGPLFTASSCGRQMIWNTTSWKNKLRRFLLPTERAALIPLVTSSSPRVRLAPTRLVIIYVAHLIRHL